MTGTTQVASKEGPIVTFRQSEKPETGSMSITEGIIK